MATTVSRRIVLGAAASLLGSPLASIPVAGSPESGSRPSIEARSDELTLTVALHESHWTAIEKLADAYAEERGIVIEAKPLAYEELYNELSIALTQQATTFDIVSLEDPWVPQFATFLTPLDAPSDLLHAFVSVCEPLSRYPLDSPPCALPWLADIQIFGSRPEWLDRIEVEAPTTWDETLAAAVALTADIEPEPDSYAFAITTSSPNDLVRSFLPILHGFGKTLIDPETSVPQLDTPEALAAIDVLQALAQLSPAESSASGEPTNVQRFASGQVAMMSNFWSGDLLQWRLVGQASDAGPLDSAAQPAQPGVARQTMTGAWLVGVPLGSAAPDEAWMFVQWLTGFEIQRQLPERALPPARTDVYADEQLTANVPELESLWELLGLALSRPRSPFYPQLEQLLGAELGNVLSGEKTGAQGLKDANVAIREFLVREGVLEA
jgi:multiple sugar transport system substrate-binding protein